MRTALLLLSAASCRAPWSLNPTRHCRLDGVQIDASHRASFDVPGLHSSAIPVPEGLLVLSLCGPAPSIPEAMVGVLDSNGSPYSIAGPGQIDPSCAALMREHDKRPAYLIRWDKNGPIGAEGCLGFGGLDPRLVRDPSGELYLTDRDVTAAPPAARIVPDGVNPTCDGQGSVLGIRLYCDGSATSPRSSPSTCATRAR